MKKIISKILWFGAAIVFALVLTVAATVICAVKLLHSEQLTPLVCRIAEDNLDASVDIAAIELSFNPSFPLLHVDVRSVEVISHSLDVLPDSARASLPVYADTLLTIGRLSGGIDLHKLIVGNEISLHSLEIERPAVNLVITPQVGNFEISKSAEDTIAPSASGPLPAISVDRFAFIDPQAIRFYNAIDSTEATVVLLSTADLDGRKSPDYALRIDGELRGPMAKTLLDLDGFNFGVDGRVRWEPSRPELLSVQELRLRGAFIEAVLDAAVSFSDRMTVESGHLVVESLDITDALSALGSDNLKKYGLDAPGFSTDGRLAFDARLLRPFCFETDTLPYAEISAAIGECSVRYGRARFHNVAVDATMRLAGSDLDSAEITLKKLTVAGPATALDVSAHAWRLRSDPAFTLTVHGNCDVRNLPPQIADAARGYIAGNLKANLEVKGAASMFVPGRFHEINAEGTLAGRNLYYLSNDTAHMVEVPALNITFDSRRKVRTPQGDERTLLSARIETDTVAMLFGGVSVNAGGLALAAAARNIARPADTTAVIPMGGGIELRSLAVRSVTDSAGMSLRGLSGRLMLNRYKEDPRIPQIVLDGTASRLAAGSPSTIFLLSDAHINASTHKIPERAALHRAVKSAADSISRVHPDLSPDSVYRLAIEKRMNRHNRRRVQLRDVDDRELIDWGLSGSFRRYLLDWQLEGSINTAKARLYTPYFPLRNNIDHLDLSFSTDSIELRGVRYRAGNSDLNITGLVSNVRRALTSRRGATLKANFAIKSNSIDINEIAGATFAGSAYAEKIRQGSVSGSIDISDESALQQRLDALASEHPDSVGPLLIPTNIDARVDIDAADILYSDFRMQHLKGQLLLFDGAVNVNNLRAVSDAGSLDVSALYSAPKASDMKFGFGMMLKDFKIEKFLSLVPAIDSIMPLMRDFSGVIDADIAATVDIDSGMNLVLPTLDAAVKLTGDSLALINPDTYRTLGKWLRFRDRADNKIKHMSVELLVRDNRLELFPFTFDIDRYKLGVMGSNDLALNFNYHIAVLKSPIPFKFGITIKGNPEHYKVRFGGAKFNEKSVVEHVAVVDTARVNLVRQIQNVFRRGVTNSRFASLKTLDRPDLSALENDNDNLSPTDSLALISEGLIEAPADSTAKVVPVKSKKKKRKK